MFRPLWADVNTFFHLKMARTGRNMKWGNGRIKRVAIADYIYILYILYVHKVYASIVYTHQLWRLCLVLCLMCVLYWLTLLPWRWMWFFPECWLMFSRPHGVTSQRSGLSGCIVTYSLIDYLAAIWVSSDNIVSNRKMNSELQRMWKEVIVARFEVISWHFPGGTEETREKSWSG
jgi:hypothetical protein